MHRNARMLFERYAASLIAEGQHILELGPDGVPSTLQQMVQAPGILWETIDLAGRPGMTYNLDPGEPYRFPFPDDSFDVVVSANVLEHVPKVWRLVAELARILRLGGTLVTIVPVSWPYHEDPVDCWRFYPEALRALYEDAGLVVDMVEWGSLELEPVARRLPESLRGRGILQYLSQPLLLANRGARLPIEGAFDSIALGHKPEGVQAALAN